jgi:hypothetical protein
MKVSAQYAVEHIADLFLVGRKGEEVEIVAPDKLTFKRVVADRPAPLPEWHAMDSSVWRQPERPRSELFGSLAGKTELAEDWDSAETNRQIQELLL